MLVENAKSDIMTFTDEATWLTQTSTTSYTPFPFIAVNVALANEVTTPPNDALEYTLLGHELTFESGNTGLPFDFVFREEAATTQVAYQNEALGSGTGWNHDWSINFGTDQPVF